MATAIGDIHGCLAPLERLVNRIPPGEELVFLGDYLDRGPDPAGVVEYLIHLSRDRPCRFLLGNHEDMMASAVEDSGQMTMWLLNGGAATLASYGTSPERMERAWVRDAFLGNHRSFFVNLDRYHEDEDTIYVHAGVDLAISEMAHQPAETLIWIREKFFRNAERWKGKRIIFGHTPTQFIGLKPGEIFSSHRIRGIDTGCVYGGFLTALNAKTQRIYQEPSDFSYRQAF